MPHILFLVSYNSSCRTYPTTFVLSEISTTLYAYLGEKALKKKNDDLTAALEKSQQQSTLKKLQEAKLQQDYADACAILDRIPPEIIREYTNRSTKKQEVRHYR